MNNVFKQVKRSIAVLSALFITGKSKMSTGFFWRIFFNDPGSNRIKNWIDWHQVEVLNWHLVIKLIFFIIKLTLRVSYWFRANLIFWKTSYFLYKWQDSSDFIITIQITENKFLQPPSNKLHANLKVYSWRKLGK